MKPRQFAVLVVTGAAGVSCGRLGFETLTERNGTDASPIDVVRADAEAPMNDGSFTQASLDSGREDAGTPLLLTCPEPCMDLSKGLVGHWKFDGDARDASPNAQHGNEFGGPSYVDGRVGGGLSFDGLAQHAEVDAHAAYSLDTMTLAAWVTWRAGSGWNAILAHGNEGPDFYGLWETESDSIDAFHFRWSDGNPVTRARHDQISTITPGAWHHLAGVFDAQSAVAQSYLDGALDQQTVNGLPAVPTLAPLWFAAKTPGIEYFDGILDEVRIYNRALNAEEVQALYSMSHLIGIELNSTSVDANQPAGTAVGTLTSVGDTPPFSFELVSGQGDADNAAFHLTGNRVVTAERLGADTYSIRVRAIGSTPSRYDQVFEILSN